MKHIFFIKKGIKLCRVFYDILMSVVMIVVQIEKRCSLSQAPRKAYSFPREERFQLRVTTLTTFTHVCAQLSSRDTSHFLL